MQIGTNSIAQTAVHALYSANAAAATASQRISTGFRINQASDDPVGMALGNKLKVQISSMLKAIDNVSQGVAMTQIVDTSLSEMVDVLGKMRETAVAAESSTASTTDRAGYQDAMDAYVDEIDSIASNAVWNGNSLMASDQTVNIQAGANSDETIGISFVQTQVSTLFTSLTNGSLDVSSASAAADTVDYIDTALDTINAYQSYMGSMATVMSTHSDALTGVSTAYSSAYGNIMNADLAQETANLAAAQIQQSGATAMLSQANNMNKELVTYLLKSVA